MTSRRRLTVVFACLALVSIASAAAALFTVREREAAVRELQERYDPALTTLATLQSSLVDQETGVRGFVVTGDERFLDPYERGRAQTGELLDRVERIVTFQPDAVVGLDDIRSSVSAWQNQVAEPEIAATREGGPGAAAALVASGLGRELFDAVRQDIGEARALVQAEQEVALGRFENSRRRITALLIGSFMLALTGVGVSALLVRRWLTEPLGGLAASIRRVGEGALYEPVVATGPPDIVALGEVVDGMRRRIVDELDAAVAAREALEQQAPAVLLLREQLAPSPSPGAQLRVGAALYPAEGVLAGDWYDVLDCGDGRVAVMVVDVSGHGVSAGGLALRTKELLTAAVRDGREPGDALSWAAHHLGDTGESFLTGFVATIDPATGSGRFANAGHPAAVLVRSQDQRLCPATGPLLGPIPSRWSDAPFELGRGDVLVVHTDGLTEARNAKGEEFGQERLRELLTDRRERTPAAVVERCVDAVREWRSARLADDLTVVAVALEDAPILAEADDGVLTVG